MKLTRVCSICKIEKSEEEYFKNKSSPDGLASRCKECNREYNRRLYKESSKVRTASRRRHKDWVKNNPKRFKQLNRESLKRRAKRNKDYVDKLKEAGCSKCGYRNNPSALHFHHLDPSTKVERVSAMVGQSRKLEDIKREIAKCILLCANCHAEEHN